jgi:hypothetical protein
VSANSSTVSAATSDKSIRDEHPATKSTVSAEDRLKAVCGTTYPSWSRDASNKEVYSCDNGKTWWRK